MVALLSVLLGISVAVERAIEIVKPLYLQIKVALFRKEYTECSKVEKEVMSILIGPVVCIIAQVGIDLPGVNESAVLQQVLAGLITSLGSNVLHAVLNIIIAIKDAAETKTEA